MAWYLRAIEHADGHWRCVHGLRTFDDHELLEDALDHLRELARELEGAAQFFVHSLDGSVKQV